MRAYTAVAQNVDVGSQQILELLPQTHKVEQAAASVHLDEQIDVIARVRFASDAMLAAFSPALLDTHWFAFGQTDRI